MRITRFTPLAALVAVACSTPDATQPELDDLLVTAEAKAQRATCRAVPLSTSVTGEVTADDCLFEAGGQGQREDLFLVVQGKLGVSDRGGAEMLTFTADTEFDAIFGVGGKTGEIFPDPVYAFRTFGAGQSTAPSGFVVNTFSLVGSEPVYEMWVGGQNAAQLGAYTLTTTVEPTANTCVKGHRVYVQGSGGFSGSISNETSCRGEVQFGPNVGAPLNFQYWWIRMGGGETVTLDLEGVTDETVAAAVITFFNGESSLDLGDGPGDTDRSASLTLPPGDYRADVYLEVSSAPDVVSPYTLTFDGPGTR